MREAYYQWIDSHYPGETDPDIIDPSADPDGDQLKNIMEYAFGLDPTAPDLRPLEVIDNITFATGLPIPTFDTPNQLPSRILFIQRSDGAVTYTLQSSHALETWEDHTISPEYVSSDGGPHAVVEVPYPSSNHPDQKANFYRIGVTLAE